jgi:hypothetical protein
MNIAAILLLICAVFAVIGIYRGLMNLRMERASAPVSLKPPERIPQRIPTRIVWLDVNEFLNLINSDPDAVIFHLTDGTGPSRRGRLARGEVMVTTQQLKDTLPWIPPQSHIVVYRPGGIDIAIFCRLAAIARGRELCLVSGTLPLLVDDPVAAGGEV